MHHPRFPIPLLMLGTDSKRWVPEKQPSVVIGSLVTRKFISALATWDIELNGISFLLCGCTSVEGVGGAQVKCSRFMNQSVRLLVNYGQSCHRLHSNSAVLQL